MNDYSNPLVYGKKQTPRIVGVHPVHGTDKSTMRYYIREEDDTVLHEDVEWYPYCFVHDPQIFAGIENLKWVDLKGDLHYNYLAFTDNDNTFRAMKSRNRMVVEETGNRDHAYVITNQVQLWLMQSGNTMFKGMEFNDVVRMQLDIETFGENHFPNASNVEDEIIIIVLSNNRGDAVTLHTHKDFKHIGEYCKNEKAMLVRLSEYISLWDPDVFELHNGYLYDFPYIQTRAELHGLELKWGRDGSTPWGYPMEFRAAEVKRNYKTFQMNGRHVIDTMFSAMSYDVIKRELPNHKLKDVSKYFGFAPKDRTYVEGDRIWWHWLNDPEPLLKYASEDVYETGKISEELNGAVFYTTPIIPMSYEDVARRGTGGKIESLFVREYIRQLHSIPKPEPRQKFQGAKTRILVRGVVGPIVHADVESLYPSNQIVFDIFPKSDKLGIGKELLINLKKLRFEWKNEMRRYPEGSDERRKWDGQQGSAKIIINSNYGTLGDENFTFNDFHAASEVTRRGRDILTKMVNYVELHGGRVIEIDTDGIYFVPPPNIKTEDDERAFVKAMSDTMIDGIEIGFDGRYEKMLSYKAKNYILQHYGGKRKIKGSSFRSRALEPVFKQYIKDGFDAVMDGGIDRLRALYIKIREDIKNRNIPIEDLANYKTINKTDEEYERGVKTNRNISRQAQYEVAKKLREEYKEPVGRGDKIGYYISGSTKDLKEKSGFRLAKLIREYDNDENTQHYLNRLDTVSEKFLPMFEGKDFADIFLVEPSLFDIDYKEIKPITEEVEEP